MEKQIKSVIERMREDDTYRKMALFQQNQVLDYIGVGWEDWPDGTLKGQIGFEDEI